MHVANDTPLNHQIVLRRRRTFSLEFSASWPMHGAQYYNWCHADDERVTFLRIGRDHATRTLCLARRRQASPIEFVESRVAQPQAPTQNSREVVTLAPVTSRILGRNADQWRSKKLRSALDPNAGRCSKGVVL